MVWSLGGPLSELYPQTLPANQDCRISRLSFNLGPYGKIFKKSSPLKLPSQLGPKFDEWVLSWSPFRIESNDRARQPRLPT